MVGGDLCDWLFEGCFKRNPRRRGSSIRSPTSHPLPNMSANNFDSDMSNRLASSLFPRITGVHPRTSFSLERAVGTISQVDNCIFNKAFDSTGRYPSNTQVRQCLFLL